MGMNFQTPNLRNILLGINLLLALALFFTKDPLGIRKTGYESGEPILSPTDTINALEIETIQDEKKEGLKINLIQGETSTLTGWIPLKNGKQREVSKETLAELLQGIRNIRTYTLLGGDPQLYGFRKLAHKITVFRNNREPLSFSVSGEGDRYGGSYILWKERVYLLPYSIHTLLGKTPTRSLLRKTFLPEDFKREDILSLEYLIDGRRVYSFGKESKDWYMLAPKNRKLEREFVEKVLDSVLRWKAIEVYLEPESSWKRSKAFSIRVTTSLDNSLKSYSLNCEWKDRYGNPVCLTSDGEVYLEMAPYDLNTITEKKETDYP